MCDFETGKQLLVLDFLKIWKKRIYFKVST